MDLERPRQNYSSELQPLAFFSSRSPCFSPFEGWHEGSMRKQEHGAPQLWSDLRSHFCWSLLCPHRLHRQELMLEHGRGVLGFLGSDECFT